MDNLKYWRRRSVKLGLLTERKAQRTARAVLDAYNRTLDNIQNRIERIFTRFVHNNDSLNAEKANRLLSARETQKYRQELLVLYHSTTDKGVRDELRAMLEAPAYANRISRLNALRDIVRADCVMLGRLEKELVGNGLADALHEAYTRQVYDIQQGTGYGRRIKTLEDEQVRAILGQKWKGNNFSRRIWKNNQAFADAVEQTLLAGTLGGLSFQEMRDMLLQITGEDASSGAKANAMRLIRTEFCHVAAQGTLLGYQSAGIEWYRYVATLDLRTSQICRELDLKRFRVDKARAGVNFPPMHPNCRSTTMPDVDAATLAKIKRAARDPVTGKSITVPGNMSYADWYQQFVQGSHDDGGARASDAKPGLKQQKQRTVFYAHLAQKSVATAGGNGIITGARITDPLSKEADEFAEMYYREIRNFSTDAEKIAKNLGKRKSDIKRIKMYLFEEKSLYDEDIREWRRFDSDCAIAQSWQRLMVGKDIKPHDRILIEHELLEMQIKKENPTLEHWKAHELASMKYNYQKAADEYYGNLKKHQKNG